MKQWRDMEERSQLAVKKVFPDPSLEGIKRRGNLGKVYERNSSPG